jgi:hypothetical protein
MKLFEVLFLFEGDDLFVNKALDVKSAKLKLQAVNNLILNAEEGSERYNTLLKQRVVLLSIIKPSDYTKALKTPRDAYLYASSKLWCRWPEGEKVILNDIETIIYYARDIIKGRWPEGESVMLSKIEYHHMDNWCYEYARYVIKGRWPEAEAVIMQNVDTAYMYVTFLKTKGITI